MIYIIIRYAAGVKPLFPVLLIYVIYLCYLKVEELKLVPEQSEKAITEFKEKLVKLEEDKKKHEEKLAEVMESLKTETKVTRGLNFDSIEFRHIYIYI